MTNKEFLSYPERKRRIKLKNVLKSKTCYLLNDDELETILNTIEVKKQYRVKLYFTTAEFRKILVCPRSGDIKVVLGCVCVGRFFAGKVKDDTMPAVIIVNDSNKHSENQLHIYIPKQRVKEKTKEERMPSILEESILLGYTSSLGGYSYAEM